MQIGELARRAHTTTKALRYYEAIGLLVPDSRTPSGYRQYGPNALDRLAFIRAAQALGFSLGEIRGIVGLRDRGETPCEHVLQLRDSGAFNGVHLIPVARYREVAAKLEAAIAG